MRHLIKTIILSLQKYYHFIGIVCPHRLPLLWGIIIFLIACCGIVYIKKITNEISSLRATTSIIKNASLSAQKLTMPCGEFSEKDVLKKLEYGASKYHLTVHSIAQKSTALATTVWTISGEYMNLLNWLNLAANQPANVAVNHFHLWREIKADKQNLFLLIEMVFYENSTCGKKN